MLRLRSGDERPLVHGQGDAVELLDAADVGDRLTGRATVEGRPEGHLGIDTDRCVAVRHDRGALHPDRVREQQLRVQPRRLEPQPAKTLDTLVEERTGRGHRGGPIRAGS
jgi:hypothetical protein